jgi:hypothetical protein
MGKVIGSFFKAEKKLVTFFFLKAELVGGIGN